MDYGMVTGNGHVQDAAARAIMGEQNPTRPHVVDLLEEQNKLLHDLLQTVSSAARPPREAIASLVPNGDYTLQDYGYNHISIFCATAATIIVKVPGLPAYSAPLEQGWTQIDLKYGVVLQSGDANTYPIIISHRDDAIGGAL